MSKNEKKEVEPKKVKPTPIMYKVQVKCGSRVAIGDVVHTCGKVIQLLPLDYKANKKKVNLISEVF
ncbi:MAG: hypothetical protein KAS32_22420 [Candidatus Peribacteraceae bacterium]|nr:hypothetical protein [Candidatus Peribacteraceae bacterium]